MIIGENARAEDLDVNPTKAKQQTNMRAASADVLVRLAPATRLTLEASLEFLREDECVEITPESVRLRKVVLDKIQRLKAAKRGDAAPRLGLAPAAEGSGFDPVEQALQAALEAALLEDHLDDPVDARSASPPRNSRISGYSPLSSSRWKKSTHLRRPALFVLLALLGLAQRVAEDVVVDLADQLELLRLVEMSRSATALQRLLEVAHPVGPGRPSPKRSKAQRWRRKASRLRVAIWVSAGRQSSAAPPRGPAAPPSPRRPSA